MITHELLRKELDARGDGGLEQEFNLVVSICADEAGDMGL